VSIPWPEFLERLQGRYPSLLALAFAWWHYNVPLLERVRQIVSAPANILEVGTGTGALAVFLAAHGYEVLGIDNDPQVIEKAREFAEYFHVPCRFELGDAFNLAAYRGRFDLAFSSGVIEHFPAEDASRMLREQGTAARYVLVAVPTWFALKNDPLTEASGARPIRLTSRPCPVHRGTTARALPSLFSCRSPYPCLLRQWLIRMTLQRASVASPVAAPA